MTSTSCPSSRRARTSLRTRGSPGKEPWRTMQTRRFFTGGAGLDGAGGVRCPVRARAGSTGAEHAGGNTGRLAGGGAARRAHGDRGFRPTNGSVRDTPVTPTAPVPPAAQQAPPLEFVCEEDVRVARMGNVVALVVRTIRRAHGAASSIMSGASAGCRRALTTAHTAFATAGGSGWATCSRRRAAPSPPPGRRRP